MLLRFNYYLIVKGEHRMNALKKCACVLGAAALLFTAGCGGEKKAPAQGETKIPVTVSFNAMKELTETIGGDKVAVKVMVPEGTEPHEFDPKAENLVHMKESKVFVYNGLGMEKWAEKAVKAAGSDKLVVVEAAAKVKPIEITDEEEREEHGDHDPHAWLGLTTAVEEAEAIRDGLIKASPENKDYFNKNFENFAKEMKALQEKYRASFDKVERKEFVTGHAAFGYLCRDMGLYQESVEDVFASGEPSAKKMKELIDFCKEHKVKTIFTEDMVSPALSETLAREAGASTEVIDTMEGESEKPDMTFLKRMEENLKKIEASLK